MLLLLWLPDERDASLSSFELLSCVVLLVYPTSGYGDVFFGFLLWFLLRFVRRFTLRAGTSISSLISSYWCVASVYCIGSPDERVRIFLL